MTFGLSSKFEEELKTLKKAEEAKANMGSKKNRSEYSMDGCRTTQW